MNNAVFKQITLIFSFWLILLMGVFNVTWGSDLKKIQKSIQAKGAKWKADENPITKLSPKERMNIFGLVFPERGYKDGNIFKSGMSGDLPVSFNWCDNLGANWVTSVKIQGACLGCWAFSSVAALESFFLITNQIPDPPGSNNAIDLSEQFAISCCPGNLGCKGGIMRYVYEFFKTTGVADEACFPYQKKDLLCSESCTDWENRVVKIDNWSWVSQDVESLKSAVYIHPIPVAFYVYEDFLYYREGVYEYLWGRRLGVHAVSIIGWDDVNQCFFAKNSFTPYWGEPDPIGAEKGGYFRIGYSQVSNGVSFGMSAGVFSMTPMNSMAPKVLPAKDKITQTWGKIKTSH